MHHVKTVLAAAAAVLLAGCALREPYTRPQAAPDAYPAGAAYAAPAEHGLAAADTGWAEFLLDPRLKRLVRVALDNNQDLRVALLRIGQARAQLQLQQSALLPQVGLAAGGSASKNNSASAGDDNRNHGAIRSDTAGLSGSWEVDFFGRLQSLDDAAREQYLATAYARQAAQLLLVGQVASQYFSMLAYDEQLAISGATLAAAQASYRIVKLRYDTGTGSELDETLAAGTLQQAQANQAAQVRLRAQAENGLVLLLGQAMPADLPASVPLHALAIRHDIPAGLPSDLLLRRPDLLQAEASLRAENANIGAARAAFFPRIALTATLGSASSTLGGLFAAGSGAWTFAPNLLLPLFDGGANQARLDAARIGKDIGVAQYRKSVQSAFREVADGLAARGTFDTELAARQRYREVQQRRLELSELRYDNGVDDYLSVLNARTDLYNAQIALVGARLNQLDSTVDLYRALGGGWLEHSGETPRQADDAASRIAKNITETRGGQ
ncbi:efflux transporter outer membrane subunit [Janthinobacterium agaricidamnosum]|uniref:Outer membrane protein oprM n=1 Tax=Janthinobacterium agaricidamnosum NBRC 102515 = DSM 9628 TaxID=1349767 RepID=W0V8Q2_9BURK|nr:efflux transporter outer membrane subunit [Janthinobacterium agaricidamnosum]CDG83945.1 outer membrane protein oprM [Janthinobacterium agaricidamnosum NBRC 102515 = DSM 9628]